MILTFLLKCPPLVQAPIKDIENDDKWSAAGQVGQDFSAFADLEFWTQKNWQNRTSKKQQTRYCKDDIEPSTVIWRAADVHIILHDENGYEYSG